MTLGVDLTYAGKLTVQPQVRPVLLNGHTLTLTGTDNVLGGSLFSGGGTIRGQRDGDGRRRRARSAVPMASAIR